MAKKEECTRGIVGVVSHKKVLEDISDVVTFGNM